MARRVIWPALGAVALLSAACGGAKAQVVMPDAQPLVVPAAPAHVVVPAAPEPPPPPVIEAPVAPTTLPTGTNATRVRTEPPASRPTAPPPAQTPQPVAPSTPTPLEAAPNQSELEQKASNLVGSAERALDKIDPKALSTDGRAQYDTAKRFIVQAKSALAAKNIVYAWQLADKANTIATLLK